MIRFAIFDLDGTILDSSEMWLTLGENYLKMLGKQPARDISDRLNSMSLPESAEFLRRKYDIPYSSEEIVRHFTRMAERFYKDDVCAKEGAVRLLATLRARCVRMSIATAGDIALASAALSRLGLSEYFAGMVSCSDYGAKTSPEVYFAAADIIYAVPEETIIFEDSLYAVRTAKKAGFATAAVSDVSEKNREELRKNADFYAESLEEFADMTDEILCFKAS